MKLHVSFYTNIDLYTIIGQTNNNNNNNRQKLLSDKSLSRLSIYEHDMRHVTRRDGQLTLTSGSIVFYLVTDK